MSSSSVDVETRDRCRSDGYAYCGRGNECTGGGDQLADSWGIDKTGKSGVWGDLNMSVRLKADESDDNRPHQAMTGRWGTQFDFLTWRAAEPQTAASGMPGIDYWVRRRVVVHAPWEHLHQASTVPPSVPTGQGGLSELWPITSTALPLVRTTVTTRLDPSELVLAVMTELRHAAAVDIRAPSCTGMHSFRFCLSSDCPSGRRRAQNLYRFLSQPRHMKRPPEPPLQRAAFTPYASTDLQIPSSMSE